MVKLFIGNLPENIDSTRLRGLFSTHVRVQECDVLKNFAFVHVANENDADKTIRKFDKYKFMGRELHVERSTSRLRKQPGMSDKCFTCGAEEHKTSQCPGNPNRKRNMNSNNGGHKSFKKPRQLLFDQPPLRQFPQPRLNNLNFPPLQNNQHFPPPLMHQQPPLQQQSVQQQSCWGYKMGGESGNDPELPCPHNPELQKLYEQYKDSRTRYFFYREQLLKELRLQPPQQQKQQSLQNEQQQQSILQQFQPPTSQSLNNSNTISGGTINDQQSQQSVIRVDLTQLLQPKKEPDTMSTLSTSLYQQQQHYFNIPQQTQVQQQQNTSILNNQQINPPIYSNSLSSLINTPNTQLLESGGGGLNFSVSAPQSFQSQQQQAYQATYNALPTNYNSNITTNLSGLTQQSSNLATTVKQQQQPTPLAAIQTFRFN
uniref:RRM domain-containing protein n=1 Tax=Meloidogyne hapla TaxID=6305 RepID=A0A1I8BMT5_MELHA